MTISPEEFGQNPSLDEQMLRDSMLSLDDYLNNVVIACEPRPECWGLKVEEWQTQQLVGPLMPAIENVAGIDTSYDGPRDFWIELPKGHDKTSFIGRLVNWCVAFSPRRLFGSVAASTKEQASRLLERANEEALLNKWLERRIETGLKTLRGSGGIFQVLSSDAPSSSGRIDDLVICDELTFWERRDLWDMLRAGRVKRNEQVFIVITNAGIRGTWQWKMRERARKSPRWHFYSSPVGKFLASWMNPEAIAELAAEVLPSMRRRVIHNEWVVATENPLLTPEQVHACHGKTLWKRGIPKNEKDLGELFIGYDIARDRDGQGDKSVLSLVELRGQMAYLRRLIVFADMPIAEQEKRLDAIVNLYRKWLKAIHIDQGALGYQIAETAVKKWPGLAKSVAMSQARQGEIAVRLYKRFESQTIVIPNDEELNSDLQQVSEVGTTRGGKPVVETSRSSVGHADRFWSLGLAVEAMPTRQRRRVAVRPRGFQPNL